MNFYKILAVCLPLIFLSGCDWFDDDEPAATSQTFEQKKSELETQIAALQNCQEGTDEEKAECQTKLEELKSALQDLLKTQYSALLEQLEDTETEKIQEKCEQLMGQLISLELTIKWTDSRSDQEFEGKRQELCDGGSSPAGVNSNSPEPPKNTRPYPY